MPAATIAAIKTPLLMPAEPNVMTLPPPAEELTGPAAKESSPAARPVAADNPVNRDENILFAR